MTTSESKWFNLPSLVLPGIHLVLCVIATILSGDHDGWGWSRMMGVDPFCAPILMVVENLAKIFGIFAFFGTVSWYFYGLIGWKSYKQELGRIGSLLGALLITFFLLLGVSMTVALFRQEHEMGVLSMAGVFQFLLVGILFAGAFVSVVFSLRNTFRGNKPAALS